MTRRTLTLTCDHCGALVRRNLTSFDNERLVLHRWQAELKTEGWEFAGDCEHDVCPACARAQAIPFTTTEESRA
ncbi:hypothetical protein [Nocardia rhizosphaerae]|uniref:Uncharacterized protein n=1 Tax=Nocardia rhizosphaerae TaxID=1691571 RepID=A0ABV8L2V2_9NOCA